MKRLIIILALLPFAVFGQTKNVLKGISTNALTEPLVVPTGKSITIDSGATITNNGTATGFGNGSVTSVALTMPSIFSVSGSPITTSGTLAASLATQSANLVFAGPTTGSAASPTFRSLVAADLPDLSGTYQPLSATLTTLSSATAAGLALMDDADAAAQRSTLGLGTLATQSATIADYLTSATAASTYQPLSGTLTTLSSATAAGLALMDDADAAAQRATLGLGAAALLATSTGGNGSADLDKAAVYTTTGQFQATGNVIVYDPANLADANMAGYYGYDNIGLPNGGGLYVSILPAGNSATVSLTLPSASGTLIGTGNLSAITAVGTLTSGEVPTTLLTGTITNAQLAGSIDLTTKVTGALPVANGGTGQATAQAAINALLAASGALSQGDVFYFDGTNVVRLAPGTSGHYLQTQGAAANPQWAAVSTGLTVGTTSVASGTDGYILYNNAGTLGQLASTGTGNVVRETSPTLVTPALGAATAASINALALRSDNTGMSTYVGYQAGNVALATDTKCTALGYQALAAMSGGGADSGNSAFGYRSLTALTTGKSNTGVGDGTLFSETTGNNNTAIGVHALLMQNGGGYNTAIGYNACDGLTTGTNNTAIGFNAMGAVVTGSYNVAIGISACGALTSGSYNWGSGDRALSNITTGSSNVAIGLVAGFSVSTGSNNIFIGQSAGQSVTGSGGVYIGFEAGKNETGSNKLYIDNSSTATPLIGGDFSANTVTIGGTLTTTGSLTIGSGGSAISKVLTATATLNFNLTALVVEDLTVTCTGAAVGDAVFIGVPNGSVTTSAQFTAWVSAADTVTVRCRTSVVGEDPASGTFRVDVHQH